MFDVKTVELLQNEPEVMCDIEVDGIHRFYTNDFLSHNSHILVQFGARAVLDGKTVFHYTMELNEQYIGIRYDSHLTGIDASDCSDNVDLVKEYFESNRDKLGRLIIKEYPSRKITCNTIRAHVEKMLFKGIKPDLIIIDYAGIIRSTEKHEALRMELTSVIQEIRQMASELGLAIWTALQSNKEGTKSDIIDVTNFAESYGQAGEADFALGLQRLATQKATGLGTLFIAKNRMGMDGIQLKIHLDTAHSRLRVLTPEEIEGVQFELDSEKERTHDETIGRFKDAIKKSREKFVITGLKPQPLHL